MKDERVFFFFSFNDSTLFEVDLWDFFFFFDRNVMMAFSNENYISFYITLYALYMFWFLNKIEDGKNFCFKLKVSTIL